MGGWHLRDPVKSAAVNFHNSQPLDQDFKVLSKIQLRNEVKRVEEYFAPSAKLRQGETVVIELSEKVVKKLFKLEGFELQFDDRVTSNP